MNDMPSSSLCPNYVSPSNQEGRPGDWAGAQEDSLENKPFA